MKNRVMSTVITAVLTAGLLAGCGASQDAGTEVSEASTEEASAAETGETASDTEEADAETASAEEGAETADTENADAADTVLDYDGTTIRVGSLKGPTTMGLVNLMKASDEERSQGKYEFTMASDPSEIVASIASGDLDIALVPANLAATLYNKTKGGVSVLDINTLGVLYCVTADESITSVKGRLPLSSGLSLSARSGVGMGIGSVSPLRLVRRMAMAVPSCAVTTTATSSKGIWA